MSLVLMSHNVGNMVGDKSAATLCDGQNMLSCEYLLNHKFDFMKKKKKSVI
jgi:hypothetical protein